MKILERKKESKQSKIKFFIKIKDQKTQLWQKKIRFLLENPYLYKVLVSGEIVKASKKRQPPYTKRRH